MNSFNQTVITSLLRGRVGNTDTSLILRHPIEGAYQTWTARVLIHDNV